MKSLKRGFTLIELLVVIAIIGILSSVVLASLNTARGKGANAAIQSDLDSMRAQAELDYSTNSPNAYNGTVKVCTDPTVVKAMTNAGGNAGATAGGENSAASATVVGCTDAANTWVIEAPLKDTTSFAYWCVDNTGNSKGDATAITTASTVCP